MTYVELGDSIAIIAAVALSFKTKRADTAVLAVFFLMLCAVGAVLDAVRLYEQLMLTAISVLALLAFPSTIFGSRLTTYMFACYPLLCAAEKGGYLFANQYFPFIIWGIFAIQLIGSWYGHRRRCMSLDSCGIHNNKGCNNKGYG